MKDTATLPRPRFTGVRLLTGNDSAWQAERHLIANASRTLDLCSFIVEIDASTSRLLLDLIDATRPGVARQCERPPKGRAFQDTDLIACDGRVGGSEHLLTFEKLWCSAETADITQPDPLDTTPPAAIAALRDLACPAPAPVPDAAIERGVELPDMDGVLFDNLPSEKRDATITRAYMAQIEHLIASGRGGVIDVVNAHLLLVEDAAYSPSLLV